MPGHNDCFDGPLEVKWRVRGCGPTAIAPNERTGLRGKQTAEPALSEVEWVPPLRFVPVGTTILLRN
jgi:hypothetical protein